MGGKVSARLAGGIGPWRRSGGSVVVRHGELPSAHFLDVGHSSADQFACLVSSLCVRMLAIGQHASLRRGLRDKNKTSTTTDRTNKWKPSAVQAFSAGDYVPSLAMGEPAYVAATVAAWVVIAVGVGLTLLGVVSEARLSAAYIF